MPKKSAASVDLKEACVRAAHLVIAERGIESLSLRDVARKLGVSHQAPYKHFASRDHLLAEIIRRCFQDFARALDARKGSEDPAADLAVLGEQYLRYASEHPLEYRLMFGTPWPQPAEHPSLVSEAAHAFNVLRAVVHRLHGSVATQSARVDLDAMYIWSSVHGLASIMQSNVMEHLKLAPRVSEQAAEHVMQMMSAALGTPKPVSI